MSIVPHSLRNAPRCANGKGISRAVCVQENHRGKVVRGDNRGNHGMRRPALFLVLLLGAAIQATGAPLADQDGGHARCTSGSRHYSVTGTESRPTQPLPPRECERLLIADTSDGKLDQTPFLTAALIASIPDDMDAIARLSRSLDMRYTGRLRALADLPPATRARLAFSIMHHELLTGHYRADCSSLSTTLQTGDYNCVTATILFHYFCQACDLQPIALAQQDHVISRVDQEDIGDIETTYAPWFHLDETSRQRYQSQYEPHHPRRILTDAQLIAKIFYNRGVSALHAKRYSDAVAAFQISRRLDPEDDAAQRNLLATWNNWALAECEAEHFPQSAKILAMGMAESPHYEPFMTNDLHIHQQWTLALCRLHRYAEARELLEQCHRRRPDADLFDRGRWAVVALEAEWLVSEGRIGNAEQLLASMADHMEHEPIVAQYLEWAFRDGIADLIAQGRQQHAKAALRAAARRFPNSSSFAEQGNHLTTPEL